MKSFTGTAIAAVAAVFAHGTSAATTSFCTGDSKDVCFKWGVPESSASSNSGNIYFQITAKDTYQWAALGIGSGMSGSDIFMIYQDGSGNVTLSTREGKGHVMPQYSERSDIELLEGSGVINNQMVANIKCSKCDRLKFSGSNSWISAWKKGDSLDSTNPRATIQQHDDDPPVFKVDFAQASISSDSNPFVDSSSGDKGGDSGSGSGSDSDSDSDSGSGSGSDSGGDSGYGGSDSGNGAVTETESGASDTLVYAHGIIMSVVFLIGYPIGALLMPLLGKWYIHAGWQTLAFLGMWAGFGIGYRIAKLEGDWWNEEHVQIGTIVVVLMALQPVLGFLHHRQYVKHQQRGLFSHAHIWYGRILIVLGIVNGGLGLDLAGGPTSFTIAYSVVAGIVSVLYIAGALFGGMKKTKREKIVSPQLSQEEGRQPYAA
ncbi:Fc.00g066130.m01.CDS01 [Cosmosporella sp. VM-42]